MSLKSGLKRAASMSVMLFLLPTGLSQSALAAGNAEEDNEALEEILVTGSYIKRSGYDERSPIIVFDREKMSQIGADNLIDVTNNLTFNSGSRFTNESGNLGTNQFNIRGLGPGSTLTLINGRRAGFSTAFSSLGNPFFDTNQLPLNLIKRIDFQTDGASATYGSSAVAGVANIITRKGFEGLEISARYQDASNTSWSTNLVAGGSTDKARFTVYASYSTQTQNFRGDFKWLRERVDGEVDGVRDPLLSKFFSSTGSPGTYNGAIVDDNGNYVSSFGSSTPDANCEAAGGLVKSGSCRLDFRDQVSIIPDEDRASLFSEYDYDITEDITVFSELSVSYNKISRASASPSFSNGLAGGRVLIPGDHPFNYYVSDGAGGIEYIDPSVWDNDIHTAVALRAKMRPFGAETNGRDPAFPNQRHYERVYYRGLVGTNWDINDTWNLSAHYVYNLSTNRYQADLRINAPRFNQAVLDGIWNPFGIAKSDPTHISAKDGVSVSGNTVEDADIFRYVLQTSARAEQQVLEAVLSGSVGQLPGGDIGVAVGGQYRHEEYSQVLDPTASKGQGGSPAISSPLFGQSDVYAAFAETILPVTDDVEIQLAIRHESHGDLIGSTTDPKIAARWQVSDVFAVRGSFGTAFQAPSVRQTGRSSGNQFIDDPSSSIGGQQICTDTGISNNVTVVTLGNENLKPTKSKNFNVGILLEPTEGLSLSLDVWHFNYRDLIAQGDEAQSLVDAQCAGVADGGAIVQNSAVIRTASGQLSRIETSFVNEGSVITNGLDIALNYRLEIGSAGDLNFGINASYVNKFDIQRAEGEDIIEGAGNLNSRNAFKAMPKWRTNFRIGWALDNHSANASLRYMSSYNNDKVSQDNDVDIDAFYAVDIRYSYAKEWNNGNVTQVSVGVNNLFDRDPSDYGTRPGYDATTHDIRGRVMYISAKQLF